MLCKQSQCLPVSWKPPKLHFSLGDLGPSNTWFLIGPTRVDVWNRLVASRDTYSVDNQVGDATAVRRSVEWYVDAELKSQFASVTSSSRATCPNTEMRRRDRRWDSEVRPVRWSTSSFRTRLYRRIPNISICNKVISKYPHHTLNVLHMNESEKNWNRWIFQYLAKLQAKTWLSRTLCSSFSSVLARYSKHLAINLF